jgi:hypothetical protein
VSDAMRDYVDVAERISIFRSKYPNGSLQPADPSKPYELILIGERQFVVCVAAAYRTPDDPRPGIGMAWEPVPASSRMLVNSELMVCETSAWGRAIVATLAADTKRVASADEIRNRQSAEGQSAPKENATTAKAVKSAPAKTATKTANPLERLVELAKNAGITDRTELRDFCSMTLERDVASASDMTVDEIARVVVALKDLIDVQ